ncbi:MAG: hypothetical protein WCT08_06550 [Patescibacteria group bacterium]|jgi:hypothetical protein
MNRGLQVFSACALGALLGTLIASQFTSLFWLVGPLSGGIFAYLAYDFQVVKQNARLAWQRVWGWQLTRAKAKKIGLITLSSFFGLVWLGLAYISAETLSLSAEANQLIGVLISPCLLFICVCGTVISFAMLIPEIVNGQDKEMVRWLLVFTNPLTFFEVTIPYLTCWIIYKSCKNRKRIFSELGMAVVDIGKFILIFLKLTHSQIRLTCLVDATIGAIAGHLLGNNLLIGALVGGILGVLNFEILSKRVFKLVSMRS